MFILFLYFSIIFNSINCYDFNLFGFSSLANVITFFNESYDLNLSQVCLDNLRDLVNFKSSFYLQNRKMEKSSGRGIDDIGNELECLESNFDSDYIFLRKEYKEGTSHFLRLSKYLRRNYTFLGVCIPKNCLSLFQDLIDKVNKNNNTDKNDFDNIGEHSEDSEDTEDIDTQDEYNDFVYSFFANNTKKIELYKRSDIEQSNLFYYISWFFFVLFFLKVIIGIIVKLKCPKGYNHYVYAKKKSESFGEIFDDNDNDKEGETAKFINEDNIQINNKFNLKGEYDPQFDLESFFPFYLKVIKCLDLFNNISTFGHKRSRYYNEKNINILCSIKSILLFYHIYTETIRVMIRLPNTNSFDYEYYNSFSLLLFKRSSNSLIFWVILESATFSFKLMNFIKQDFKNKQKDSTKRIKINLVLKKIFKFFYFYIPKIITFIFVYVFLYYLFDKYNNKLEAKMTYKFISTTIIKDKSCNGNGDLLDNLLYTFIPFMNYNKRYSDKGYYTTCYPFTYIYINMFFSSIFFMILLIIIFYFQKKIIDVIIFIVIISNLIGNYIYFFYKDYIKVKDKDKNQNKTEILYSFNYFTGENYCIYYFHIFFCYYFIGCILGLNIYNLGENKQKKLISKRAKRKSQNKNEDSRRNSMIDNNDIDDKEDSLYEPMEFCSTFILKLNKMKTKSKFLFLFIYIALSIFVILVVTILFNFYINEIKEKEFDINISNYSHTLMNIYFWEKLINVILFSFFILLISVIQKKFLLIKILKSNFFIPISRVGFFVTCAYQSMTFIFFCLFQLRIKNAFFIILNIAIGFYILIITFSILFTILIELPFRIIFKHIVKCLKNDENDNNILKLLE